MRLRTTLPRTTLPTTAAAILLLVMAGCAAVGPDYVAPVVETGDGWSGAAPGDVPGDVSGDVTATTDTTADATVEDLAELAHWWRNFDDPTLERLIESALGGNLDLQQALARVDEARAAHDAVLGRRRPTVDATGSVEQRRQSENGALPIDRIPGLDRDQTIWQAGFDARFEVDLFGRVRRSVEAAGARAAAAAEDARAVRLRVLAEVARHYFELRGAQHRLAAREAAVEAARQTLELTRQRHAAGDASLAEVTRAEAELLALEARLPELAASARASALALGVLAGKLPESELALAENTSAPVALRPFPVGERAEILARRPDVRAAERRLAAATAGIGLAMAERFPRLAIGANGGFQALDPGDLLSAASQTWSIVPRLSWRLFDGGRVEAEIHASEARAEAAARAYEAAVLAALGEAEQALVRYRFGLETLARQERTVEAAARALEFARQRHRAGDASLIVRLDAERAWREAEEARASAHAGAAVALVSLYKALGGGWGDALGGDLGDSLGKSATLSPHSASTMPSTIRKEAAGGR